MLFSNAIIGLLALVAGQAFALPAQQTHSSNGMISNTKSTAGEYFITNLLAFNSSINCTNTVNNIIFHVHGASDAATPALCSYEWPANGTYYVPTYTPCNGSYQFLISDGSFHSLNKFELEIEHFGTPTVVDGFEESGTNDFALTNVTAKALHCASYKTGDIDGTQCKQTKQIIAETYFETG